MDAGAVGDDDAGVACMPPKNPFPLGNTTKCSEQLCPAQDSICLPITTLRSLVPQSTIDLLAKCDDMTACVPVEVASQAGRGIAAKCSSVNGAEGRCTSTCVPLVAQQANLLPRDNCKENELCAPCYDPRTSEDTLACRQGCDRGPTQPPKPFDRCCSDRGLCVPPALAGSQAKNLNKEACTGDTLCAPKELADLMYKPKSCDSIDNGEGRCISTCVGGALGAQKDRLPTAGCASDEICAPCYDPVTGEDTGACTINGDKPQKTKYVFQKCCGQDVGVCVPPALAGSQADVLRQETCPSGKLCAPVKKAADPKYKFQTCTGLGEGVCINSCIVDPTEAAILPRASCANGEVCAPCSLLGAPTGACD
jgi:hypothetical protein